MLIERLKLQATMFFSVLMGALIVTICSAALQGVEKGSHTPGGAIFMAAFIGWSCSRTKKWEMQPRWLFAVCGGVAGFGVHLLLYAWMQR